MYRARRKSRWERRIEVGVGRHRHSRTILSNFLVRLRTASDKRDDGLRFGEGERFAENVGLVARREREAVKERSDCCHSQERAHICLSWRTGSSTVRGKVDHS